MRCAVFVEDNKVVNFIILEDGVAGDDFVASSGCIEVTNLDPMPQIGWDFDGESFSYTPTQEEINRMARYQEEVAAKEAAILKLTALGLTEEEAKALFQ